VKSNINSVEVHSQPNNNGHPVDGALAPNRFPDMGTKATTLV